MQQNSFSDSEEFTKLKAEETSLFGAFVAPMDQKGDGFGGGFSGVVDQNLNLQHALQTLSRKHL